MKKGLFLAIFSFFLIGTAYGEQMRVRVLDTRECAGPGDNEGRMEKCVEFCDKLSGRIDKHLAEGWKVVNSRDIELVESPFKTNKPGVPDAGYCKCKGSEYILEK